MFSIIQSLSLISFTLAWWRYSVIPRTCNNKFYTNFGASNSAIITYSGFIIMFRPECTQVYTSKPLTTESFLANPLSAEAFVAAATSVSESAAPDQLPAHIEPVRTEEPGQNVEFVLFKNKVKEFVTLQARIQEMNIVLKELRDERTKLQEDICAFMGENEIEDLHTRNMRLQLKTTSVAKPLKKAELRSRIKDFLGGEDRTTDFFDKVYDSREKVEKTTLRRLKTKK